MRRLIVHLGDHKTGTTSIQYALAARDVRPTRGTISYPLARLQLNHNYLKTPLLAFGKGEEPPQFETLRQMFEADGAETSIISAETLEGVAPEVLHRALVERIWPDLPRSTIHAIAYVRPHASRILSSSVEQVKVGWMQAGPVRFFARSRKRFFYAPRFARVEQAFDGRFTLRASVPGLLREGTILHDFLTEVFGEGGYDIAADRTENASLCMEDLMRVAALQREIADLSRWERHAVGWFYAEAFSAARRTPGTAPRLARPLAERIRETYREDAQTVDSRFFGGRPILVGELDRTVDEAQPEVQSFDPADWLTTDGFAEMRDLAEELRDMAKAGGLRAQLRFKRLEVVRGADIAREVAAAHMERMLASDPDLP